MSFSLICYFQPAETSQPSDWEVAALAQRGKAELEGSGASARRRSQSPCP